MLKTQGKLSGIAVLRSLPSSQPIDGYACNMVRPAGASKHQIPRFTPGQATFIVPMRAQPPCMPALATLCPLSSAHAGVGMNCSAASSTQFANATAPSGPVGWIPSGISSLLTERLIPVVVFFSAINREPQSKNCKQIGRNAGKSAHQARPANLCHWARHREKTYWLHQAPP